MRGRKPKPTALKLIQGNPGKRPLDSREPKPAHSIPTCPAHLNPSGKAEWKRLVQQLHRLGIWSSPVSVDCYRVGSSTSVWRLLSS